MALYFIVCGVACALITRNAMAVVLLSAVILPLAFVAAYFTGASIIGSALLFQGAFVLGAVLGFACLLAVTLIYPGRFDVLKVSLTRKTAGDRPR